MGLCGADKALNLALRADFANTPVPVCSPGLAGDIEARSDDEPDGPGEHTGTDHTPSHFQSSATHSFDLKQKGA